LASPGACARFTAPDRDDVRDYGDTTGRGLPPSLSSRPTSLVAANTPELAALPADALLQTRGSTSLQGQRSITPAGVVSQLLRQEGMAEAAATGAAQAEMGAAFRHAAGTAAYDVYVKGMYATGAYDYMFSSWWNSARGGHYQNGLDVLGAWYAKQIGYSVEFTTAYYARNTLQTHASTLHKKIGNFAAENKVASTLHAAGRSVAARVRALALDAKLNQKATLVVLGAATIVGGAIYYFSRGRSKPEEDKFIAALEEPLADVDSIGDGEKKRLSKLVDVFNLLGAQSLLMEHVEKGLCEIYPSHVEVLEGVHGILRIALEKQRETEVNREIRSLAKAVSAQKDSGSENIVDRLDANFRQWVSTIQDFGPLNAHCKPTNIAIGPIEWGSPNLLDQVYKLLGADRNPELPTSEEIS